MIRTYQTIVEIFDFGPYVTKIICPLPFAVPAAAVTNDTFNVYVERRDRQTGDIMLLPKDFFPLNACLPKVIARFNPHIHLMRTAISLLVALL